MKKKNQETTPLFEVAYTNLFFALEERNLGIIVEDDYPDFKDIFLNINDPPYGVFSRCTLLMVRGIDNKQIWDLRFLFYANPLLVGEDKRSFRKNIAEDNFRELKEFAEELLEKSKFPGILVNAEMLTRSKSIIRWEQPGKILYAACQVELIYENDELQETV